VGSHDTASVVRNILTRHDPVDYVGVDLAPGPGVDVVCPAEGLLAEFGPESFDVLVTTELLEHVRDWRAVVHNLKCVLRDGGVLVGTTRSPGFEFHGYTLDFWRYDIDDIRTIFGDFDIETLEEDPDDPGVFFRARRPALFHERDLTDRRLLGRTKAAYPVVEVTRRRSCPVPRGRAEAHSSSAAPPGPPYHPPNHRASLAQRSLIVRKAVLQTYDRPGSPEYSLRRPAERVEFRKSLATLRSVTALAFAARMGVTTIREPSEIQSVTTLPGRQASWTPSARLTTRRSRTSAAVRGRRSRW
jgi:hypothetical protein